jgi:hypothetical protein
MTRARIVVTTALWTALAASGSVRAQDAPRTDGWVVLGVEEYRALRAKAFPAAPDPVPPPVEAALTRVDYDLRVAAETVTGEVRLTIDVLKQGWVSVQVPSGLLIREARLDGRRTTIVDGTPPRVLVSRAGRSTLALDVVVPLAMSAGSESMTLPPSGSALTAVALIVPRTSVDLAVTGGFLAEQTESATESRWLVYGSPGRPLAFSWKRKADDRRATLPLRARARITELVALGEETTQVTASVRLEVAQGVARQIELALPEGLVVNQVQGATVGDWNQLLGCLTVSFLEPVAAEASLVLTAEIRMPREGAVAIPIVRWPLAERETGGIAVDVVGPGEIGERQLHGLEPADASDLGDIVSGRESPSIAAFRFKALAGTAPRDLTVTVSRYTPQAVLVANVEEARYDALVSEDGKTLIHARYAVRNNQRSFLAVTLPPQSILWSATLSGRPIRPGIAASSAILLPLQKGRAGEEAPTFVVELVYLQRTPAWTDKGTSQLELPAVDLPVSRTGLSLHHSPRFHVDPQPGRFRVEPDRGPWSATLSTPPPPPPAPPAPKAGAASDGSKDLQALLDRFQREAGRTATGVIPVQVRFPELGPAIFLAAELTAESQFPSLTIDYKRAGGR